MQGRYEDALEVSREAIATAPADYLFAQSRAWRVFAKSLARAGKLDEAKVVVSNASERLSHTDTVDERGRTAAAAGEVFALAGAAAEAKAQFSLALHLLGQKGNTAFADHLRDVTVSFGEGRRAQ
jgi:tetratricopeptide (TPR) repeat protein